MEQPVLTALYSMDEFGLLQPEIQFLYMVPLWCVDVDAILGEVSSQQDNVMSTPG